MPHVLWPNFPYELENGKACALSLLFLLKELVVSFEAVEALKKRSAEEVLSLHFPKKLSYKEPLFGKLCFYSEILIQNSKRDLEDLVPILEHLHCSFLKLKSHLEKSKKRGESAEVISEAIFRFVKEGKKQLRLLFHGLEKGVDEMKADENVLMYLIEKRKELNRWIKPRAVETLLKSLFPNGHIELKETLLQGYLQRGFLHIFEEKKKLVDEIEWEEPCHPLAYSL